MILSKRHLVLYGLLGVGLLVLVGLRVAGYPHKMSYTVDEPLVASSTDAQDVSSPADTASSTAAMAAVAPKPAQTFKLEVVKDEAAQERGLGGRASIPENYGMLFVFPKKSLIGFWMKDMLVPIDIVWLSDDGTVLGIEDSISPSTYPDAVYPPKPVRYVLETRAGEMRRQGWHVGARVPFTLP